MRLHKAVVARGIVVIRANGLRNAPKRHRQFGVKFARALEGARRFVVIERVNLPQALVEERLRLRVLRRDRVMPVAVAGHQRSGGLGFRRRGMVGVFLRQSAAA